MATTRRQYPTRTMIARRFVVWCMVLPSQITAFPGLIIGGVEQSVSLGGNVGGFNNVRFEVEYSLPEGVSVNTNDIEALLCRTQDYLGDVVYDEFVGQQLEVKATEAKWENLKDKEHAVSVSFTALLTGINGTVVPEMPSPENLREAFDGLDMNAYLTQRVQAAECPTVFSRATKVEYETKLTPDITGIIPEPVCQTTCAPTLPPGVPTIAPTKFPTAAPSKISPKENFMTDEHEAAQLRPDHTRNPSGVAPKPVSAVNPAYMPPVHLTPEAPSSGSGGALPTGSSGGGDSSSSGISSSTSPGGSYYEGGNSEPGGSSGNSPGEVSGSGPGGTSGGGSSQVDPAGGGGQGPSYGSGVGGSGLGVTSVNGVTGPSLSLMTGISAGTTSSGSGVGGNAGPEGNSGSSGSGAAGFGMENGPSGGGTAAEGGPMPMPLDHTSPGTSPVASDSASFTSGSLGIGMHGVSPGAISSSMEGNPENATSDSSHPSMPATDNPNHSDAESGPSDMIFFTLTLGFFEGKEREASVPEIKSLICYTQDFFADELKKLVGDRGISFEAIDIDWSYNEDGSNSFELRFAANVRDGMGMAVPENQVFQSLKVAQDDLQDYILSYAWEVPAPKGETESVFYNTEEVNLRTNQNVPIPLGQLPHGLSESCDNYQKANISGISMRSSEETAPYASQRGMSGLGNAALTQTHAPPNGEQLLLFTLDIGFFEGYEREPTDAEVEGAICNFNEFVDEDLRHALVDEEAKTIIYLSNWQYTEGEVKPVSVDFALEGVARGGEPLSADSVYSALKLDSGDLANFIEGYMWKAPPVGNVFRDTSQMGFIAKEGVPVSIESLQALTLVDCQNGTGLEDDLSVSDSFTITEEDGTLALDGVESPNDMSPPALNRDGFGLPGVPAAVANQEMAASVSMAASSSSDSASDVMSRIASDQGEESADEQVVAYNLIVGFYDEKQEPSVAEIQGLMCQVLKYFTDFLKGRLEDPSVEVLITNIGWTFDEDCHTPLNAMFGITATLGDGTRVGAEDMFQAVKLGNEEILDLIENYVYESKPEGSPFADVNQLQFEESTVASLPEGTIDEATCPDSASDPPTPGPGPNRKAGTSQSPELQASYKLAFGFYDGKEGEPSKSEIESLICQTNAFFQGKVREKTGDSSIEAYAVDICWNYTPDCDAPVTVSFGMEAIYESGESVPPEEVSSALKLSEGDMQAYLESYVWQSSPTGSNLFNNANKLGFEDYLGGPMPEGNIARAVCPALPDSYGPAPTPQRAPEPEPTPAAEPEPAPTEPNRNVPDFVLAPTVHGSSNSNDETPTADATSENAILYHLEFAFEEGSLTEPTPPEIAGMICETTEFFDGELQAMNPVDCFKEVSLTKIDWTYDEDCPTAPVTVTFAAQALYCDGSDVPVEVIYDSLKLEQQELKTFLEAYIWEAQPVGESVFSHAQSLSFEGTLHATVRPGKMEEVHC